MNLVYDFVSGEFLKRWMESQDNIAKAATGAIIDAADIAKTKGRAAIASGGFSSKWQNALRAKVYPQGGVSMKPAAFIYHKIPYAWVFEEGATISGKPLLWLPLPGVPKGRGNRQLTPQEYMEAIGPLIKVKGRDILLGQGTGILRASKRAVRIKKKAVAAGTALGDWVPMFVGHSTVGDPQKFDIIGAVRSVESQLGELYIKHLET
jgi:hypothetical protein